MRAPVHQYHHQYLHQCTSTSTSQHHQYQNHHQYLHQHQHQYTSTSLHHQHQYTNTSQYHQYHLAPGEEQLDVPSGRVAEPAVAPAPSQVPMPAFAAAPADPAAAPANPAVAAAPLEIRRVARSATGDVSYLVTDTSTGFQVTQTTSRMFGSDDAAKRAAERLMAEAGRGAEHLRFTQLKAALRDAELHGKPIPDRLLQAEGEGAKGKGEGKAAAAAEAQKGKGEEAAAAEAQKGKGEGKAAAAAEAQKGKGEEAAAAPLLHLSLRGGFKGQPLRPPRAPSEPKSKGKGSATAAAPKSKGKGEASEAAAAEESDTGLRTDSSDST